MSQPKLCVSLQTLNVGDVLPDSDMVELRLDLIDRWSIPDLKAFLDVKTKPVIVTLRSAQEGGGWKGSEEARLQSIREIASLNPDYLDIEHHVPLHFIEEIRKNYPRIKVILSYHDFEGMPKDLEELYRSMKSKPASLYKIAGMAKNSLAAMRLLSWQKSKTDLIAIAMGPFGQITRILAPLVTYAAPDSQKATAPWQLTLKVLKEQYRYSNLNQKTEIYGLIGGTVDQSVSDVSHNALLEHLGLNAVYVKIAVQPDELGEFLKLAKELPIRGLSVTIPLKEKVMAYLEEIDPKALEIGAVNTLHFHEGKIKGYNTDCLGALNAIGNVKGKRVLIIGAGGAARAIAYEATLRGAHVIILNRNREKALTLAADLNCVGGGLDEIMTYYLQGYDVLINSTPSDEPIDIAYVLKSAVVMDIKTKAVDTSFLKNSKEKGCGVVYGYHMFVDQAVEQFAIWFDVDKEVARDRLCNAVRNCLKC